MRTNHLETRMRASSRLSSSPMSLRFVLPAFAFVLVARMSGASVAQDAKPQTPQSSATFTCIVVDGRTQVPIADAEVRWYELEAHDAEPFDESAWMDSADELSIEDYGDDDARAKHAAHLVRSDERGQATILGPLESTILVARSGSLWGRSSSYLPNTTERKLDLFPDADIVVNVRDVEGRPAPGVPVVVQYRLGILSSLAAPKLRATSDEHGTVRIAHAGFGIERTIGNWNSKHGSMLWSLAAEICSANRPEIALDANSLPKEPLELHLPALGEVELVVSGSDGRAATLELRPQLMLAANVPNGTGDGPSRGWIGGPGPRVRVEAKEGRALFRNVALGAELALKVQPNTASQTWVKRFQGPTNAGERVRVELKLESGAPTFVGRLVDGSKRPLSKVRVATDLFSLPAPTRVHFSNRREDDIIACGWGTVTTDADGGFSISYSDDQAHGGVPVLVLCTARNEAGSLAARVDLAASWTAGAHSLGDVVLSSTPIVASGKVVEADGKPITGAFVGISVFKGQAHITATTDANGDFELRSAEPYDRLDLSADARAHLSAFVHAAPGARDLRIVLAGAGSFGGTIVFPRDTQFGDFYFHIERTVQGRSAHGWWEHNPSKGAFSMRDLEPGTYRLFVRRGSSDGGQSILVRDDIVVRAGETTKLEPIDLAKVLEKH